MLKQIVLILIFKLIKLWLRNFYENLGLCIIRLNQVLDLANKGYRKDLIEGGITMLQQNSMEYHRQDFYQMAQHPED